MASATWIEACCLFCYKNCDHLKASEVADNDNKSQLLIRFFRLMDQEFLQMKIELRVRNPYLKRSVPLSCCPDCLLVLDSFCEYYTQVKVLEMKMNWRLWTLTNIMMSSESVQYRRGRYEKWIGVDSTKVQNVRDFKEEFVKKCSLKLQLSGPSVKLKKFLTLPGSVKLSKVGEEMKRSSALPGDDLRGQRDLETSSVQSSAPSLVNYESSMSSVSQTENGISSCHQDASVSNDCSRQGKKDFKQPKTSDLTSDLEHYSKMDVIDFVTEMPPNDSSNSSVSEKQHFSELEHYSKMEVIDVVNEVSPSDVDNDTASNCVLNSDHEEFGEELVDLPHQGGDLEMGQAEMVESAEEVNPEPGKDKSFEPDMANGNTEKKFKENRKSNLSTPAVMTYACNVCSKRFWNAGRLLIHVNQEHGIEGLLKINLKDAACGNEEISGDHHSDSNAVESETQYKCQVPGCSRLYFTEEDLGKHAKYHGSFKCLLCDEVRTYAPDLSLHEAEHNPKTTINPNKNSRKKETGPKSRNKYFACAQCDYGHGYEAKYINHHLEAHMNITTTEGFACAICQKPLIGHRQMFTKLRHHYTSYHDTSGTSNPSLYRCGVQNCPAFFLTNLQLCEHGKIVHQDDKIYQCSECECKYKDRLSLRKHRQKKHPELLNISCAFDECDKVFFDREEMELHLRIMHTTKTKKLVCPKCSKVFYTKMTLDNHLKTHDVPTTKPVVKQILCPQCGKVFRTNDGLQNHLFSHSGPGSWKFKCEICSKRCINKGKLNEHLRTHSKEKLFACEHCGVRYAHRHNLRIHINSKHGDIATDIPRKFDKSGLVSRKGIKSKQTGTKISLKKGSRTRLPTRKRKRTYSSSSSSSSSFVTTKV